MTLIADAPRAACGAAMWLMCAAALGCDRPVAPPTSQQQDAPPAVAPKLAEPQGQPASVWTHDDAPLSIAIPEGWARVSPEAINPQAQVALRHPATKQTVAFVWAANRYEGQDMSHLRQFKHEALEHLRAHIPQMQVQHTSPSALGAHQGLMVRASARLEGAPVAYVLLYALTPTHQLQVVSLGEGDDTEAQRKAVERLHRGIQWKTKT